MIDLTYTQIKALAKEYSLTPKELAAGIEVGDYEIKSYQEAEEQVAEYIKESIWAFRASFLAGFLGCPVEAVEAIQANDKCEDNNQVFLAWLSDTDNDLKDFIEEAIAADGLGHFLSSYDGEFFEVPGSDLVAFRVN